MSSSGGDGGNREGLEEVDLVVGRELDTHPHQLTAVVKHNAYFG